MFSSYAGGRPFASSFSLLWQSFIQAEGLPFSDVLSTDDIQQAFEAENVRFAQERGDIYTPAITLWAFLSQTLHAGRLRSCAAAVSRVIVLCVALGRKPPSPDTGAYCRARAKLPESVLQRLVYEAADHLESRVPADWLWLGRQSLDSRRPRIIHPRKPLLATSARRYTEGARQCHSFVTPFLSPENAPENGTAPNGT